MSICSANFGFRLSGKIVIKKVSPGEFAPKSIPFSTTYGEWCEALPLGKDDHFDFAIKTNEYSGPDLLMYSYRGELKNAKFGEGVRFKQPVPTTPMVVVPRVKRAPPQTYFPVRAVGENEVAAFHVVDRDGSPTVNLCLTLSYGQQEVTFCVGTGPWKTVPTVPHSFVAMLPTGESGDRAFEVLTRRVGERARVWSYVPNPKA